ncbi:Protein CBG25478 [Caenorhabditis briggsae]|uniref:Protein CBG25478 n=1 Tax=Caenorhabditis briggsae TaxID=6238 RepID=B6IIV3_CAEBR|nr:Protein CBG25478 [Caenorhabditis briggsae]CAR99833.1 Protein CBG25478 [Caenorhabditis briggsae]
MVHRGLKTPVAQKPAWQDSTLVPLFSYYSLLEYRKRHAVPDDWQHLI